VSLILNPNHGCALNFVSHRLKVQDSTSALPLSAVIATNQMVVCVMYEVVLEDLHKVRISLPRTYPCHHVTRAVLTSLPCLSPCYNPQLHSVTKIWSGAPILRLIPFGPSCCSRCDLVHLAQFHSGLLPEMLHKRNCIMIYYASPFISVRMLFCCTCACRWEVALDTQGTARNLLEGAAEEDHQVRGRSLAQINSRLFELTGSIYLSHIVHLQGSHLSLQSINDELEIFSRDDCALPFFRHDASIQVTLLALSVAL
jgi:hypothetical protein